MTTSLPSSVSPTVALQHGIALLLGFRISNYPINVIDASLPPEYMFENIFF
jgi:hypothetical protein